jgi:hypothetical protein
MNDCPNKEQIKNSSEESYNVSNLELIQEIKYIEEEFEFVSGKLDTHEKYQKLIKERKCRIEKGEF